MNKSVTEEWKDNIRKARENFMLWLDEHDAASWPAFFVFFTVITLGMLLNFMGFQPVFGMIAALAISGMFEAAIISWKLTSNRKRNDAKQNQLASWATWLSVGLSITMLIINLFRIGGEWFSPIAYGIVGAAAVVQVVFYIMYDNSNPDKALGREHSQAERVVIRKRQHADDVIAETEAELQIVRKIANELLQLRNDFADLPTEELEYVLEEARSKLLSQYSKGNRKIEVRTRHLSDINKDGVVGRQPTQAVTNTVIPPEPIQQHQVQPVEETPPLAEEMPTEREELPTDGQDF